MFNDYLVFVLSWFLFYQFEECIFKTLKQGYIDLYSFFKKSKHFYPSIEFYNMAQVSKSSTLSLRFCNSRTLLFIYFISNTPPCSQLFGRQGTHGWLLPCNRSHFVFSIRSNWGRKYYRFILGSAQGKRKHSISWIVTVFPISNTCISSVVILTAADICKVAAQVEFCISEFQPVTTIYSKNLSV